MSRPTPEAPDPSPLHRKIRILLIALPLLGLLAVLYPALRTPLEWREGGAIVRPLAGAEPKASVSIPLTLREGGDIAHESEHVFEALSRLPGTSRCRLIPSPPSVEVAYDPKLVSEKAIREALAAAGYGGDAK